MSTHADSKPWTVPALAEAKRNGQKLVMLTAYDAGFARTFDANGVDLILVGGPWAGAVDYECEVRAYARSRLGERAIFLDRSGFLSRLPDGVRLAPERISVNSDYFLVTMSVQLDGARAHGHWRSAAASAHWR